MGAEELGSVCTCTCKNIFEIYSFIVLGMSKANYFVSAKGDKNTPGLCLLLLFNGDSWQIHISTTTIHRSFDLTVTF